MTVEASDNEDLRRRILHEVNIILDENNEWFNSFIEDKIKEVLKSKSDDFFTAVGSPESEERDWIDE